VTEAPLNVNLITRNDLCISCGACKHACPAQTIHIQMNDAKGFYEPVIADESPCLTCETRPCLTVCPGYEENFVDLAGWSDPAQQIGPYEAIYTGHNTDGEIRKRASSGGIIKELCRYYLESGQVDGVITLRHIEGLEYAPDVYTEVEDVLRTPGSIYHNINFENAIEILKTRPGRYLLIAIPCQLTSIRKWERTCPEQVVGQIAVTVGLICGWMFTRHTLRHFARWQGVDYDDLQNATYRGGDKFGALVLETSAGGHAFSRRPNFWKDAHTIPYHVAFSRTYNSQRCLLCVEHLNYLADIAVGDAWLDAFKHEKDGTSIIVVRKAEAGKAIEALMAAGRLVLKPATEQDVIDSQSADLAKGISAQRITNRLKAEGQFAPTYTLPAPVRDLPSESVWQKNYLEPKHFRAVTWATGGYGLYRWRVLRRWLATFRNEVLKAVVRRFRRKG
jgi:coenzyme F420 hydrogenase subunit beta